MLITELSDLATDVGTKIKALHVLVNNNATDLTDLDTTDKTNLVAAINELVADIDGLDATVINDAGTTTDAWSASKIITELSDLKDEILGGAGAAYDTLIELSVLLQNADTGISALTTSIAAKAPIASPTFTGTVSGITKAMVGLGSVDNTADTAKPVSTAQQTALDLKQDAADIGDTDTDLVAIFQAALI